MSIEKALTKRIEVVPYNPDWSKFFEVEKE
ncbi:MAG: GrpB family protein [Holosporaceae bacterium]|jgi:GrpB-like predicted nucleotidyltransferase (UPF0157 family)|nr:GrpB family protein [Holosporaceae bacterium]